ncbi:WbuC family cupin fold metalloprotein [Polynucleobacter sp. IMCC30063]|uniref:WbuC family cupin fold metalloprotein n=1 Tax=Polynucleobacter sp. IMCC30063 TaxID=2907298 RepID=UPI001F226B80|nr:WbuC family cupin fold metalloprotein [Polynucleobacter sp. IMCC30063]MCE7505296.1 WbuC family cupin fold metalloprotein [Polynucleobacter sp. IMCC30063]
MKSYKKNSPLILYPNDGEISFTRDDIAELKAMALANPEKKIRFCTHDDPNDLVHEMIIVHTREYKVIPHKHTNRNESIYIIEGEVDILLFGDNGKIQEVIEMGDLSTSKIFYYKMPRDKVHTFLILSEILVFKEVTQGPFNYDETIFFKDYNII